MDTFLTMRSSASATCSTIRTSPRRSSRSSERPELEDAGAEESDRPAKLSWQPRSHDPHLRKWLHRIKVPTLLVWGANDRLFPQEYAFAYQQLIPGIEA